MKRGNEEGTALELGICPTVSFLNSTWIQA
jgi:hypothetical protein